MTSKLRQRFSELHAVGTFVMPNPWDVGSARLLEALGFPALATTSSGYAASLGRLDQQVTLDELLAHVVTLVDAIDIPLNVDAERLYADEPEGVAETARLLAGTGAAGFSIEDYDPVRERLDPLDEAVARVGAAAEVARTHGLVLTARAENHLYGVDDLDDTIARLQAYRDAGAHVVYAPGLASLDDIARVVRETGAAGQRARAARRARRARAGIRRGPPRLDGRRARVGRLRRARRRRSRAARVGNVRVHRGFGGACSARAGVRSLNVGAQLSSWATPTEVAHEHSARSWLSRCGTRSAARPDLRGSPGTCTPAPASPARAAARDTANTSQPVHRRRRW